MSDDIDKKEDPMLEDDDDKKDEPSTPGEKEGEMSEELKKAKARAAKARAKAKAKQKELKPKEGKTEVVGENKKRFEVKKVPTKILTFFSGRELCF
jgi:phage terminase Nu1 subunit (DNA packaging protein)